MALGAVSCVVRPDEFHADVWRAVNIDALCNARFKMVDDLIAGDELRPGRPRAEVEQLLGPTEDTDYWLSEVWYTSQAAGLTATGWSSSSTLTNDWSRLTRPKTRGRRDRCVIFECVLTVGPGGLESVRGATPSSAAAAKNGRAGAVQTTRATCRSAVSTRLTRLGQPQWGQTANR